MNENSPEIRGATAPRDVAAVVLAAGRSSRMAGGNKLLMPVGGAPMVRNAAEAALGSGAGEVIVVTGFEAPAVEAALAGLDVRFVRNAAYAEGLSSSLKAGIAAVAADKAGALVLLGDMPRVTAEIAGRLIARFCAEGGRPIVRPVHDGRPGNPVLWPRRYFAEIMALSGDVGARELLKAHAAEVLGVDVADDAIHMDVDTAADLESN